MSRKVINIIPQKSLIIEKPENLERLGSGGTRAVVLNMNLYFNDNEFELIKNANTIIIKEFNFILFENDVEYRLSLELKRFGNYVIGVARYGSSNVFVVYGYESEEEASALDLHLYSTDY